MLTMRKASTLLIAIALVGCGDQAGRSITSPRLSPASGSGIGTDRGAADETQKVEGHGEFVSFGVPTRYSNEAKRSTDGVKGHFEIEQSAGAGEFHIIGDVMCLTVTGTSARLGGVVEKSTNPDVHPGEFLVWSLVDNDASPKHSPDMSSDLFLESDKAVAQFHCDNGLTLPPLHPVKGHFEVKTMHGG